jgi:hypothetical protein
MITESGSTERENEEAPKMEKSQWEIKNRIFVLYSALQKAIRWGEVNDARCFAQEFIEMGMPGHPINRLLIIASEDVGLADPTLLRYVAECVDTFESAVREREIPKANVSPFPEIRAIIDRAVIAAALSYKSRLLPMLCFATLFEIYKKEDFSCRVGEYESRFRTAIQNRDEKEAAYYAYVLALFLGSANSVLEMAQEESRSRNTELIHDWIQGYRRKKEIMALAGIVSLLCRDLDYPHGEYLDQVSNWLSRPIEKPAIPDRAYDMHTYEGKKKGRGLEHFFNEAASVRNERFPNDWEEVGKKAYFQAQREGVPEAENVINAIKERVKKESVTDLFKV